MNQRREFVELASMAGANVSELCRRFAISRSKGYKWLGRYQAEGLDGLGDRSRRPLSSPLQTDPTTEAEVLRIRAGSNNVWGGRKIARVMQRSDWKDTPSPSTITAILRRHGKLEERKAEHPGPFTRFERAEPNELWQMDFKGHFAMDQGRCHPLTVLDDHSRYSLGLQACADEQERTVRERLTIIFRCYGLPFAMLTDNGPPWGCPGGWPFTLLSVWLIQLNIRICHGRPYHPQTQGKDERFHRTLKAEVIDKKHLRDLAGCQRAFDVWRDVYNHERPHDALGLQTPGTRYRPSASSFPDKLPDIVYWPGDAVRKVDCDGFISFKNRPWRIGHPFRGQHVGLRPIEKDGLFHVYFCNQKIGAVDLCKPACGVVDIERTMPTTPQDQQQKSESGL